MKYCNYILLCMLLCFNSLSAQEDEVVKDTISYANYLEDQFYFGLTYNIIQNRPNDISQNNLSNGVQLGFIKDLPINKARNKGFGIGLGYSFNSYFHNLRATETSSGITYQIIDEDVAYKRNKYITHLVEMPIEFRWRTSTGSSYKFWRIYGGVKLGYLFSASSKYVSNEERTRFANNDFNRFQYGLHLSAGYNTWNFYAYYGLNKLFKSNIRTVDGETIDMNAIKIGLMFYIL